MQFTYQTYTGSPYLSLYMSILLAVTQQNHPYIVVNIQLYQTLAVHFCEWCNI